MGQLTVGDFLATIRDLKDKGMSMKEIGALPIYIGDDDELNGIHCGWYANIVDSADTKNEDNVYLVDMINTDVHCIELNGKAILIS